MHKSIDLYSFLFSYDLNSIVSKANKTILYIPEIYIPITRIEVPFYLNLTTEKHIHSIFYLKNIDYIDFSVFLYFSLNNDLVRGRDSWTLLSQL